MTNEQPGEIPALAIIAKQAICRMGYESGAVELRFIDQDDRPVQVLLPADVAKLIAGPTEPECPECGAWL